MSSAVAFFFGFSIFFSLLYYFIPFFNSTSLLDIHMYICIYSVRNYRLIFIVGIHLSTLEEVYYNTIHLGVCLKSSRVRANASHCAPLLLSPAFYTYILSYDWVSIRATKKEWESTPFSYVGPTLFRPLPRRPLVA